MTVPFRPDPPTKQDKPGKLALVEALAKVFASNLAAPFSDRKADEWASSAMDTYGQQGGDISRHATLFGLAGAGGAVTGEAALSAIPVVKAGQGASKLARVGLRAAEGAVQNAGASAIGSAMEGQSGREAAQRALVSALTGAGIGGGVGALSRQGPDVSEFLRPSRTPMDPQDVSPLEFMRPIEDRMTRPIPSVGGRVVGNIQPKPDIAPLLNLRARAGFANPTGRPVPPRLRETAVTSKARGASERAPSSVEETWHNRPRIASGETLADIEALIQQNKAAREAIETELVDGQQYHRVPAESDMPALQALYDESAKLQQRASRLLYGKNDPYSQMLAGQNKAGGIQ